VIEETGEQVLFLAESDHAVAQVSGRKHVEVLAEAAGGASVIGDGDDGGEVGYLAGVLLAGGGDVAAESAQERGEAGSASEGDYAQGLEG
jgi:hypothetical protein